MGPPSPISFGPPPPDGDGPNRGSTFSLPSRKRRFAFCNLHFLHRLPLLKRISLCNAYGSTHCYKMTLYRSCLLTTSLLFFPARLKHLQASINYFRSGLWWIALGVASSIGLGIHRCVKQGMFHKRIKQHKSGCLCAVCIVRRRRKERDSLLPSNQSSANNTYAPDEFKDEENSPIGNPESERTSSSLDQSPDPLSNADIEEPYQEDMEIDEHHNKGHAMIEKHVPSKSGLEILQESNNRPSKFMLVENLSNRASSNL